MDPSPFSPDALKGVTQDEISKLTKAMKDGQFRSHMEEYTKEISDPANRKEYITYLEQLEAQGEMPEGQCLLRAEIGCCVKTSIRFKNGQTQKLFINIVHSDQLDDLEFKPADKGGGRQVHLPYSLSPPRPDRDLKDEYCMTSDCAVSSRTFFQAAQNPQILKMIVDTACDGLGQNFLKGFEEVKKDFKVMEKLKCKGGFPMPMSVRAESMKDKGTSKRPKVPSGDAVTPSELRQMRQEAKDKKSAVKAEEERENDEAVARAEATRKAKAEDNSAPRIRVPKHRLIHSGSIDLADYMEAKYLGPQTTTTVPKVLRLIVELPTIKKSSDVTLEVTSNNIVIEVPGKYYLDLPLSYEVYETAGTAKFDKAKQELTLELPVVPKPPIFAPQARGSMAEDDDGALSEGRGESEDEEETAVEASAGKMGSKAQKESDAEGGDAAGQDWIDRLGPSEPAAPAAAAPEASAPLPEPPKRQTLEFDERGSSLHIAGGGPEEVEEAGPLAVEGQEVDDTEEKDLPAFVQSDFFDGARPGYYFGTGEDGLGYFRDSRQPIGKAVKFMAGKAPIAEARPTGPLVQEVVPPPKDEEKTREPLPPLLQRYVDASSALNRRLPAGEVDAPSQAEPAVESHQNRQNVLVFMDLPRDNEVADLQVAITGHRLTVSFCTRPLEGESSASSSSSRWKRQRLRRTLYGVADLRQWHAELLDRGEAATPQLGLIMRKVRRGDMWPQVFDDAAVPAAHEPWEAIASAASQAKGAQASGAGGDAIDSGGDAGTDEVHDETGDFAQDSAELDVAPPTGPAPTPAGPGAAAALAAASAMASAAGPAGSVQKVTATAAMVQSATVMGQSVLLTSQLMYQLL